MLTEISKATSEDLERVIEIYSSGELKTSQEEARWFVRCYLDYHNIIVVKVDGEVQGACFWRIEGERYCGLAWIENLWVERRYRRLGLAETLLKRAIEDISAFFDENGIEARKIVLMTQVERAEARALYEKLGFQVAAELGRMYDPAEPDLLYALDL